MSVPKGIGYYIKYLNNILKCMDTSMIDGYSKKVLSDSASLLDIMSVASDIDDLSFLEDIFTAGSDTSLFFNSFDFMRDSLYSSNKERLENSIRDVELRNKVVSYCGDLLDDDIEIVDLDGGYDVSSFDDGESISLASLEDSDSFKSTVDSVSKSMEFSFDDDDDDTFDDEYDDDESIDNSIYDVDDSEFDDDEDYEDDDALLLEESDEDDLNSIYDSALLEDEETDEDDESELEETSMNSVTDTDSIYDSAFDDEEDEEDEEDTFEISDSFFDSLSISEDSENSDNLVDSANELFGEDSFETSIEEDDFEDSFVEDTQDDNEPISVISSGEKDIKSDSSAEMFNNFVDNEPKQLDDDLFSLEPANKGKNKSGEVVDNSSILQDENTDLFSFDDFGEFEDDESSQSFPEDTFDDELESEFEDDGFEISSGDDDFESLVSVNDDSSFGLESSELGNTSFEDISDDGYQELEEKPIQKTFDDSLADGIVKIAELFNKNRRSQMVNKMKSFIEDHKVTPEDEE